MATPSLDEETAAKVLRQVEFYFSDSNLPRDGFLNRTINESEDGLVSLALICAFSRMRSHLELGDVKPEDISEDTLKAVAETLRPSGFLKLSADGKKIGRSTELAKPEEIIEQVDSRTIAASPFEYDIKRDAVEALFSNYGKVNSVRLPRLVTEKRFFCGTALIEFSTEEDATAVLKQSLTYAGVDLELKPKKDFDAEREKQTLELEKSQAATDNNSKKEPGYTKGLIVSFNLKHKSGGVNGVESSETEKPEVNEDEAKPMDVIENDNGKTSEPSEEEEEEEKPAEEAKAQDEEKPTEEKSTVKERPSARDSKDDKDVVLREDLKVLFQRFGHVKYVDFTMGDNSGFIRFDQPEEAQKARAAAVLVETGLEVKNYFATVEAVIGDAEKEYWGKLRGNQDRYHEKSGGRGRGNNRGNFRGGRNFHGKRGRDHGSGGGRPNKSQKVTT